MTKEQVEKGHAILHKIELCQRQLDELRAYSGNKYWIAYGQDKGHCNELSLNPLQFEMVQNKLISIKEAELEQLEIQLNEL